MTREEAKAIVRKEYLCVDRDCDIEMNCGKCDLMIPSKELILEAYKMAIKALEQEPCGDAIDRVEAIKIASGYCHPANVAKELAKLPSVNPQLCDDAISRQAVLDGIDTYINKAQSTGTQDDFYSFAELVVKALPPVNPQEPKTGHWIEHPEIETSTPEYLMFYECSECGDRQCFCKPDIHKKRFCSNCGFRMVEPQERSRNDHSRID